MIANATGADDLSRRLALLSSRPIPDYLSAWTVLPASNPQFQLGSLIRLNRSTRHGTDVPIAPLKCGRTIQANLSPSVRTESIKQLEQRDRLVLEKSIFKRPADT
jgi:hypothetical protein